MNAYLFGSKLPMKETLSFMDMAGIPNLVLKDSKFVISFSSILSSKYFLRNGFNSLSPNSLNSTVFESLMIEDSMC